jgi:hypothetical protein
VSLGKFPSATWSPRPRRLATRCDAHRSAAVLPLCVRADRCHSPYCGLKDEVLLRNEGAVTLLVIPGYKTAVVTRRASTRVPPPEPPHCHWHPHGELAFRLLPELTNPLSLPHTLVHPPGSLAVVPYHRARRSGSRSGRSRPAPSGQARPSRPASFSSHKWVLGF